MSRRLAICLLAGVAAVLAPAAPAAGAEFTAGVAVEGDVTVEYEGAGVSGVASWSPPRTARLEYERGRRQVGAALELLADPATTRAQVTRVLPDGTARTCTDARRDSVEAAAVVDGTTEAEVGLRGRGLGRADLFTTRCAGPRPEDLAAALPARRVALAALRGGPTTVDLRGETPFDAGGFHGIVRSTLVLRVARSRRAAPISPDGGRPGDGVFAAEYAVERVTGAVRTDLRASGDPARCGPLDACGLGGSLTLRVPVRRGTLRVFTTRGGRPGLRAAVGLRRPGERRRRRVPVIGTGFWRTAGGSLEADLARTDGGPSCRDRVGVPALGLFLSSSGGRLDASLMSLSTMRTRCPGPIEPTFSASATGSVPLRALQRRRIVVRLRTGSRMRAGGFVTASTPDVTVVLRRTGIREIRFGGVGAFPELAVIR